MAGRKSSWMLNSRVSGPPPTKMRLDCSHVLLENKRLDRMMEESLDSIHADKLKMQAENKFALMRAKLDEPTSGAPGSGEQCVHTMAAMGSKRTRKTSNLPFSNTRVTVTESRADTVDKTDNDEGENSDSDSSRKDKQSTSSKIRQRPYTAAAGDQSSRSFERVFSARVPSDQISQIKGAQDKERPKTAFATAFGKLQIRSYKHLKSLLNTDGLTRSRYKETRDALMKEKATEKLEEDDMLAKRMERFYNELDTFILETNPECAEPNARLAKQQNEAQKQVSAFAFKG